MTVSIGRAAVQAIRSCPLLCDTHSDETDSLLVAQAKGPLLSADPHVLVLGSFHAAKPCMCETKGT
jgi:hypothetical protein